MAISEKRTQLRAKTTEDGATEIFVLISHPMETGLRTNPQTKEKIPVHIVQKITFYLNGKEIAVADTGTGVAANPLVSIRVKNVKKGDKVRVSWTDNFGQKDEEDMVLGDAA
jgi:sulfur-oxidizing protein SoxZ